MADVTTETDAAVADPGQSVQEPITQDNTPAGDTGTPPVPPSPEPGAGPGYPPSHKKLWQMMSDGGQYSKSYEDFTKQFDNPDSQKKLFDLLRDGDQYHKSYEDFTKQFFTDQSLENTSKPAEPLSTPTEAPKIAEPQVKTTAPDQKPFDIPDNEKFSFDFASTKKRHALIPSNAGPNDDVYSKMNPLDLAMMSDEDSKKEETPGPSYFGGTGGAGFTARLDPAAQKESQEIDTYLQKKGLDRKTLVGLFGDMPSAAYDLVGNNGKKNQTRDLLLAGYMQDPVGGASKINNIKTQFWVQDAAYNAYLNAGYSKEDARRNAVNAGNGVLPPYDLSTGKYIPYKGLADFEAGMKSRMQVIGNYLTGEQRHKALTNFETSNKIFINAMTPGLQDEYNSSGLGDKMNADQFAGLKTLQIFEPQKYDTYLRQINLPEEKPQVTSTLKGFTNEVAIEDQERGRQSIMQNLLDIGSSNRLSLIESMTNEVRSGLSGQVSPEVRAQLLDNLVQLNEQKQQVINSVSQTKFPLLDKIKYDQQVKELTQRSGMNAIEYGTKSFFNTIFSQAHGLADNLVSLFGTPDAKARWAMQNIGDMLWTENDMYLPEHFRQRNSPFVLTFDPSIRDKVKGIIGNRDFNDIGDADQNKVFNLLADNQWGVRTVNNPNTGNYKNLVSLSTLYSNFGMVGSVLGYAATTAGLGMAGLGRAAAAGLPMFLSTSHDAYNVALSEGDSPNIAAQKAFTHGSIMYLAGTINPAFDIVKRTFGAGNTAVGGFLSKIDEGFWNKTVSNNWAQVAALNKATVSALKEMGGISLTFGAAPVLASDVADKYIFNKDISGKDMVDHVVDAATDAVLSSVVIGASNFANTLRKASAIDKAIMYNIASKPDYTRGLLQRQLNEGQLSPEDFTKRTKAVAEMEMALHDIKPVNDKGFLKTDSEVLDEMMDNYRNNFGKEVKPVTEVQTNAVPSENATENNATPTAQNPPTEDNVTPAVQNLPTDVSREAKPEAASPDERTLPMKDMNGMKVEMNGVKGTIRTDEENTMFFDDGKKEVELGKTTNESFVNSTNTDHGIKIPDNVVNANGDGSFEIRGKNYKNPFPENPLDAISYDDAGDVKSVHLQNDKGQDRHFRGFEAEDIAYQIHLKELTKDNGTRKEFTDFLGEQPESGGTNGSEEGQRKEAVGEVPSDAEEGTAPTDGKIPATEKAGTVGKEITQKFESAHKEVSEHEITRTLPNGEKMKGRYALVPAMAVTPSHDSENFSPSKGFPTLENGKSPNDRDYQLEQNRAAEISRANKFDGRAIDNVPTATSDGVIIDGNGRTISGQIAARNGTDGLYNEALQERLPTLGFSKEQYDAVAKEGSPRLVFISSEKVSKYDTALFSKFNKAEKKGKSPSEKAIELNRTVNDKVVGVIGRVFDEHDNMSDFYGTPKSTRKVFDALEQSGVLSQDEMPTYYDRKTGVVTASGKEFLENLLTSKLVNETSLSLMNQNGIRGFRNKILKAILPLMEAKGLGKEWDLGNIIDNAIRLKNDLLSNGMGKEDFLSQKDLFNEKKYSKEDVAMFDRLEGGALAFKKFADEYVARAKDAAAGQQDIFGGGKKSREDILEDTSKSLKQSGVSGSLKSKWQLLESMDGEGVEGDQKSLSLEDESTGKVHETEDGQKYRSQVEGDYKFSDVSDGGTPPNEDGSGGDNLQDTSQTIGKEFNSVRLKWNEFKQVLFTGNTRPKSPGDVAFIMRQLESKSVEHAFAVHIDSKGTAHLQFLGMGGFRETPFDIQVLLAGVKRFKSVRVTLVHNHPSSTLIASNPDILLTQTVDRALSTLGVKTDHIIMDTYLMKYLHFTADDTFGYIGTRPEESKKNEKIDTQVMDDQEVLNRPVIKIRSSADIVKSIQQARFSAMPKSGMLILRPNGDLIANYLLPGGINEKDVIAKLGDAPAASVIFYGNSLTNIIDANRIVPQIRRLGIQVLDVIQVDSNGDGVKGMYRSAADEFLLREQQMNYGTNSVGGSRRSQNRQSIASDIVDESMSAGDKSLEDVLKRGEQENGKPLSGATVKAIADAFNERSQKAEIKNLYATVAGSKPAKTGRITVKPIVTGEKGKKLNEIIRDVSRGLNQKIVFLKAGRKFGGFYWSVDGGIRIKYSGNLDTTAHEVGHSLDDRYSILKDLKRVKDPVLESELSKFSHTSAASEPPKGHPDPESYTRGEGFAEWLRAFVLDPDGAIKRAPNLYSLYKSKVSEKDQGVISKFSEAVRIWAASDGVDLLLSNVRTDAPKPEGILKRIFSSHDIAEGFRITHGDWLDAKFVNSMRAFEKAFEYAKGLAGIDDVLPSSDPTILARLLLGYNGRFNELLHEGLRDSKDNLLTDKEGNVMNYNYLIESLDNTDQHTIKAEVEKTMAWMLAERVFELGDKFSRDNNLIGSGGGIFSDTEVAKKAYDQIRNGDKAQFKRIEEGARRYRAFADGVLRYMVEKGRMSKEYYDFVKSNNIYYVAMNRIMEVEPGVEYENFKGGSNKVGSVKTTVRAIKGSSREVENPYVNLLDATYRSIKEADRNEVLVAFTNILQKQREMYEGPVSQFAEIGVKLITGDDKNGIPVFRDGKKEVWVFQKDVNDVLKGLDAARYMLPKFFTLPATIVRETVTKSPVFGVRNTIRDTQTRMIISNDKSRLLDFFGDRKDWHTVARLGGLNAGYYVKGKDHYYGLMKEAYKDIAKNKGTIFSDPSKIKKVWEAYNHLLEKSETLNRVAEYRAAFRNAKKRGMDDYNASLYAAFKSRDMMDFAVAGSYMHVINQVAPFSNAAVQGVRSSIVRLKEDPLGFSARMFVYSVLPATLLWMYNHRNDEASKDYEALPWYQRDLYSNFRIGPNKWMAIPKPYELGMTGASVDRALSKVFGYNDSAFDGYAGNVYQSISPLDMSNLAGPAGAIIQAYANKDFFRGTNIVNPIEDLMDISLKHTETASWLSQKIQKLTGIDARKLDFVIRNQFAYVGQAALKGTDMLAGAAGAKVSSRPNKFDITDIGLIKRSPAYNSQPVQDMISFAKRFGLDNGKDYDNFHVLSGAYFDAKTNEDKEKYGRLMIEYSKFLMEKWKITEVAERKQMMKRVR